MIHTLYVLSLFVVILTAVVIAAHPDIPCGVFGMLSLFGVAVSAMAGFEWDPPHWVEGLVISLASTCIWVFFRWQMGRLDAEFRDLELRKTKARAKL